MQEKCLKTSVYVNKTIYSDSTEQAIDIDFTLPDYCPDISKIFKCQAVPRISSKGINGKTITLDGIVVLTLLYADKEGRFCSYEYPYPFSKNIEMPTEATGANLFCRIRCDYINCRAVTGRKVDIHGAAGINLRVFKRKSDEIICDYDDTNVELRRVTAPATVPMGFSEKYLQLEEDISVGQGQPAIQNVLKVNSAVCVKETRIVNDKAVAKGELTICILYCPEGGGNPQVVKSVLPYSQIVEIDGITDSCECETKAEICFLEVKPRISSNGENKSFSLNAKILLTCEAFCGNDIPVITDAFSRKFEANIEKINIAFDKITCNINETYHCKKNVELESTVNSVIDMWCNIQSCSTKFENSNMVILGALAVGMIICDENNIPLYYEKTIDFEYKYPFENTLGAPHCIPEIEVLSCGYTITSSNNIELRVDIGINASIYEKRDMSLISDMQIDETKTAQKKSKAAMVIYFSGANECVWDIAREFSAAVEEIMNINNLESEYPPEGTMLLVPMV